MLIHRAMAIVLLVGIALIGSTSVPVAAEPPAECDIQHDPWCFIEDGKPGTGQPGGPSRGCAWNGQQLPCQDPDLGYYIGNGCYWKRLEPPPATPPPSGSDPARGAWGVQSCHVAGRDRVTQNYLWMNNAPDGPSAEQLALRALAKIQLRGAQVGIVPDPAGKGAVGLPVWLWTAVTPGTWGPLSASDSAGGITVTITARAQRIVWNMGDGNAVTCPNTGTPYEPRFGNSMSPTCGYRYTRPSSSAANPAGRYTITAITHWQVNWSGGGQSGVLTATSQSQSSVQIGEIQVVGQ